MHVYEIIEANVDGNTINLPKGSQIVQKPTSELPKGSQIVQKTDQQSSNKTPPTPIPSDTPKPSNNPADTPGPFKKAFKATWGVMKRIFTFKFQLILNSILEADNLHKISKEYAMIMELNNCSGKVVPNHTAEWQGKEYSSLELVKRLNHRVYKMKKDVAQGLGRILLASVGADLITQYKDDLSKVPHIGKIFKRIPFKATAGGQAARQIMDEIVEATNSEHMFYAIGDYMVGDYLGHLTLELYSQCDKTKNEALTFSGVKLDIGSIGPKSLRQDTRKLKKIYDEILVNSPMIADLMSK